MNDSGYAAYVLRVIALVVVLILATPLVLIWALDTLFPALAIPYSFSTWLAALILAAMSMSYDALKGDD